MEPLRDRVVTSLLQASLVCTLSIPNLFEFLVLIDSLALLMLISMYMMMMILSQLYQEGLLRVILDGGPSRVFFPGDSKLLEEDVEVLKVIPQLSCKNSLAIHLML